MHAGGAGNGQAAKICNNMILGVSMIAVSEAFVLAEKLGLDKQKLFDIASKSSGQCWSMTNYCPVPGPVPTSPANRDYQAGFTAAMMLKDLKLAQDAAKAAGAEDADGRGGGRALRPLCRQRRSVARLLRHRQVHPRCILGRALRLTQTSSASARRCRSKASPQSVRELSGVEPRRDASFARFLFRLDTQAHLAPAYRVNRV